MRDVKQPQTTEQTKLTSTSDETRLRANSGEASSATRSRSDATKNRSSTAQSWEKFKERARNLLRSSKNRDSGSRANDGASSSKDVRPESFLPEQRANMPGDTKNTGSSRDEGVASPSVDGPSSEKGKGKLEEPSVYIELKEKYDSLRSKVDRINPTSLNREELRESAKPVRDEEKALDQQLNERMTSLLPEEARDLQIARAEIRLKTISLTKDFARRTIRQLQEESSGITDLDKLLSGLKKLEEYRGQLVRLEKEEKEVQAFLQQEGIQSGSDERGAPSSVDGLSSDAKDKEKQEESLGYNELKEKFDNLGSELDKPGLISLTPKDLKAFLEDIHSELIELDIQHEEIKTKLSLEQRGYLEKGSSQIGLKIKEVLDKKELQDAKMRDAKKLPAIAEDAEDA